MKLITAIIKPFKLDDVRQAVADIVLVKQASKPFESGTDLAMTLRQLQQPNLAGERQ